MHRVVNKSSCGGNFTPCWFSHNNSETVKATTLVFCSIQYHFIIDIRAKFGIPNLPHSSDIRQNSDGGIPDFWISSQCLIKGNCHNSRTSDDIDMTRETKQCQKNVGMMPCRQIVTSLPFFRFMANLEQSESRIPDV